MKVKQILKMLKDDGWYLNRTKGSHRQLKHPLKSGLVTVSGKPNEELAPGTQNSIFKQARLEK
ncbi:MAG: addiction module toxin, HicA family [Desulfobacterales bacterium]|nr:addiction module toxin, HicA family [Desulfobacterales bacterium]